MFTKYYAIWAGICIIVIRVKYVVEFREREKERGGVENDNSVYEFMGDLFGE
jgi:hypothetical protein